MATETAAQPVVINALHYVGQANEPVGVVWKFYHITNKHDEEVARALGVEAGLRTDVDANHAADSKAIADEIKRATNMENGLWATIVGEVSDRQTGDFNNNAATQEQPS